MQPRPWRRNKRVSRLLKTEATLAQMRKQSLPPFAVPTEKDRVRETMSSDMIARNAVPAAMDDSDPRLRTYALERHVHFRLLTGAKGRLSPTENKALARQPHPDAADFEDFAARQRLREASTFARLECKRAWRARREREQRVRRPPQGNIAREQLESACRRGIDPHGHENLRNHVACSTWRLKAASCALHSASVSSSQRFNSVIGFGSSE